jgi:hypothetical protein
MCVRNKVIKNNIFCLYVALNKKLNNRSKNHNQQLFTFLKKNSDSSESNREKIGSEHIREDIFIKKKRTVNVVYQTINVMCRSRTCM